MWREKQIAFSAKVVNVVSRFGLGRAGLSVGQKVWPLKPVYAAVMGYRRPFATLKEASAAVAPYSARGHENGKNAELHLRLSAKARPSDYAALFYLQPVVAELKRVFDLGGNVGNLYYCYSQYLEWSEGMVWTVKDLPENMDRGRVLAGERGADRLRFSGEWSESSGVDLLVVSGSLHYMEKPLAEMIGDLAERPRRVLINRTPLTDGEQVATIQDAGDFRIACMLYNRAEFVRGLEGLGYEVRDQWAASELSMEIPGYPEHKVWAYTGMFLELKES